MTIVIMSGMGKRRARRIPAALSVRLWGMDANGRPFIELSKTENVSRNGVDGIVVSSHLQTGMGVKFAGLTKTNAEAIERCIEELSETRAALV